jgi:hypothetical protein
MISTVPFTIGNVFGGLAESDGILSVDGADLKFEFRTIDGLIGLFKSDVREVKVPIDKIEEIKFDKGFFGCELVIRVSEMRAATAVPNFSEGEIELEIDKKHSSAAEELVSHVQLGMAARKGSA